MKTVVVVRETWPVSSRSHPVAEAFEQCFGRRGWNVVATTQRIKDKPDLVAGYGFRDVMHNAWDRWPERLLHVDLAFWGRYSHMKLALGGRWSELKDFDYDGARLHAHGVKIRASREAGKRILVCGMSAKAAISAGLQPEEWERTAINQLRAAGAKVIYRPKPSWLDAKPLPHATYDQSSDIESALSRVCGVVSHHSNCAVDALAAGLPIYVETGIAQSLSVRTLEDVIGAKALDIETRARFLRQVAWHQWTLAELASGAWLKPPAPLADHPIFGLTDADRSN